MKLKDMKIFVKRSVRYIRVFKKKIKIKGITQKTIPKIQLDYSLLGNEFQEGVNKDEKN